MIKLIKLIGSIGILGVFSIGALFFLTSQPQKIQHDGTLTGPKTEYYSSCSGELVFIFENEKILFKTFDGSEVFWTQDDIDCYKRGQTVAQLAQNEVILPITRSTPTGIPSVPNKQPLPSLSGSSIFNSVNAYRVSRGRSFLAVSEELCHLAEERADYMMANNMAAYKATTTGNHTGLSDLTYSGSGVGENLAANVSSTENTIQIWKNSPPHNDLLLSVQIQDTNITKGCVATRVKEYGSIVVLLVGDK